MTPGSLTYYFVYYMPLFFEGRKHDEQKNLLLLTCFKSAIEIVVKDDGSMVYATGRHEYPNVRLSVRSLTKDCLQIY